MGDSKDLNGLWRIINISTGKTTLWGICGCWPSSGPCGHLRILRFRSADGNIADADENIADADGNIMDI